jgi:hypothetical protein
MIKINFYTVKTYGKYADRFELLEFKQNVPKRGFEILKLVPIRVISININIINIELI